MRAARRSPLALVPLVGQGLAGALLVALGLFPAGGESAPSTAAFPLGVYFDLKQSLAYAPGWLWLLAAVALGVAVRGAVLAGTLWLMEGRRGSFLAAWKRAALLASIAALALFPAASFLFVGVATRYAPFVWIGALAGFITAALLARRAARLDAGGGKPPGRDIPEMPAFLAYGYVVVAAGAVMSLAESRAVSALVLMLLGPLHALFLVGWREHLRNETSPGGGILLGALTIVVVVSLFGAAIYDRLLFQTAPQARPSRQGTLLLLGGVDSTPERGALAELHPRDVGRDPSIVRVLSYRGGTEVHSAPDTRRDLSRVAEVMARQIRRAEPPRVLLGHSQASLIVDRLLRARLPAPQRSAVFAPSPPVPPPVEIPPPDERGPGKAGGDVARLLARALDLVGLQPFDVDSPASPTNLEPVVVARSRIPRLALWALGDSVWLDQEWPRPGETNVVVVSDHVGVTNNARALELVRKFFEGGDVEGDEATWRGTLTTVLRLAFEPWRPGR